MNSHTQMILSIVEITPSLRRNTHLLKTYAQKQLDALNGKPIPEELRDQFRLAAKANVAQLRLFQALNSVSDPIIRALLIARAGFGMPWELMQFPDGGNAKTGVIAWLDEHGHELVFKNKEG